MTKTILLAILIYLSISINACKESPKNLTDARNEVKEYYESGQYDKELDEVIKKAKKEFEGVKFNNNSVVIFDIDETSLNNYELAERMGFGYVYKMNKEWNSEMKAPAIPQVKDLYDFLLKKGSKIIFLTGRNFPEYDVTYQNLLNEGYTEFDTLITQIGDETKLGALAFKSGKRSELTKKGYEIVGTVGDQWSDLNGEFHGIQVKIPNYLYLIQD